MCLGHLILLRAVQSETLCCGAYTRQQSLLIRLTWDGSLGFDCCSVSMCVPQSNSSWPPLAVATERGRAEEGSRWSQTAGSHWLGAAVTALSVTNHNSCDLGTWT